ncbi:MAG: hypothetical protein SPF57_08040 [Streptococcus orisratti]|uniref:hypothetical protein n=1 Tax=Streptococcus orisratti TaxID=114652 RepID=UPI002A914E14|nr:hypothetical protein [Streptococcus orisratti]MDY5636272.1 hypothetical protein [Streptococcus orisratti]
MFGKIFINTNKEILFIELPQGIFSKDVASQFRIEQKKNGNKEFLFTKDFFLYFIDILLKLNIYINNIKIYPNDEDTQEEIIGYLKRNMGDDEKKILLDQLSNREIVEKIEKLEFFFGAEAIEMNNQGIIIGNNIEGFIETILIKSIKGYLE